MLYNPFNKKLNYKFDVDENISKIRLYTEMNKNLLTSFLFQVSKKIGLKYNDIIEKKEIIEIPEKNFSLFEKKIKNIVEKIKKEVNKENKNFYITNEKITKIEFIKKNNNIFIFNVYIVSDAIWLN